MSDKKNNRLNNIIKDLQSSDKSKILIAIKQLRSHGKREAINPLIEVLAFSDDDEIKQQIKNLLFDLKDQSVVDDLINAIENDKYNHIKPQLIEVFWQSKLDGSSYITNFINQAINGDYYTGIEVLTVIDNFDATFSEEEIQDIKYDLDEVIMQIEHEDIDRAKLLYSIKVALDSLDIEF